MSKNALITTAVGSAFVASLAAAPVASAGEHPFALSGLVSGYQVADNHMTKPMEEHVRRAGAKRLVLTHFYPECDGVDIETQCRKTWQGPLTLAEDLMKIGISPSR